MGGGRRGNLRPLKRHPDSRSAPHPRTLFEKEGLIEVAEKWLETERGGTRVLRGYPPPAYLPVLLAPRGLSFSKDARILTVVQVAELHSGTVYVPHIERGNDGAFVRARTTCRTHILYVCVHVCVCVCMCVYVCVHVCVCMYVYMYVCVCMCTCMCVCVYVCVCMCMCLCVCVCVCMCVYVCVYCVSVHVWYVCELQCTCAHTNIFTKPTCLCALLYV